MTPPLVSRCVTFTQATTQGGLTGAIPHAQRAQLLTGANVFRVHRAIVDHIVMPDPALKTLPQLLLRGRGDATFHTGKWQIASSSTTDPSPRPPTSPAA